MKKILFACSIILLASCTDSSDARRVLENDGYTDIEMTGYRPFMCSDDDTYKTGFKAKKNGHVVTGAVCGGLLKGNTIRLD